MRRQTRECAGVGFAKGEVYLDALWRVQLYRWYFSERTGGSRKVPEGADRYREEEEAEAGSSKAKKQIHAHEILTGRKGQKA
nr:hypothetical protein [uncultured Acetatifactor sp.]